MSRMTVPAAPSSSGTKPSIVVFEPKTVAPATVEIANPNTKSVRRPGARPGLWFAGATNLAMTLGFKMLSEKRRSRWRRS